MMAGGANVDPSEQDRPVVHFTDAAHQKILELLTSKGFLGKGALRISVKNPGLAAPDYGMSLEDDGTPGANDALIAADGFYVLVDMVSLPLVDGATVDFFDQLLQRGFKVDPPPAPPPAPPAPHPTLDMSDPVISAVHYVLEQQVNPGIASHGGHASLIDVKDDVVYVALGGGCQGCSMAAVTLKQGVERMIKEAVPSVKEVVDATDHAGGDNPYFSGAKGGASPYETATKG